MELDANKIGWHCGVFATIAVAVAGVAFLFAEKE